MEFVIPETERIENVFGKCEHQLEKVDGSEPLQPETKEQAALREKREAQIKAMKKMQAAAAKAKK